MFAIVSAMLNKTRSTRGWGGLVVQKLILIFVTLEKPLGFMDGLVFRYIPNYTNESSLIKSASHTS